MSLADTMRDAGYHLLLRVCNAALRLPGHALRLWVLRRLARCEIGPRTAVERGVRISRTGGVTIGAGCNINAGVLLDGRGGLVIGEAVNISPEALLLTADHDFRSASFDGRERGVVVEDRAWISTRAIVLPGTTIGEGAVVGAGAVISGAIHPRTVWIGNPARQVAERPEAAQTRLPTYRRWFH
jgi:acetyltransferase-like isoleucine patch superfamily enzyme